MRRATARETPTPRPNDIEEFSLSLTSGQPGKWHPGAPGYLPDLMAQNESEQFLAGLKVKTRANINWGWFDTEVWQSQLDRYGRRTEEIGGGPAPST